MALANVFSATKRKKEATPAVRIKRSNQPV